MTNRNLTTGYGRACLAKPIKELSIEDGLSDVGLAKICHCHNTPVPPRGLLGEAASRQARVEAVFAADRLGRAGPVQLGYLATARRLAKQGVVVFTYDKHFHELSDGPTRHAGLQWPLISSWRAAGSVG